MKRKLLAAVLTIFVIAIGLGLTFIIWALHGPSLDSDQIVSVSSTPSINQNADPYFKHCDTIDCSCDCNDPFDPRIKSGKGEFEGKCLNSCIVRTALQIADTLAFKYGYLDKVAKSNKEYKYLVNVNHIDKYQKEDFYVAAVNTKAVKKVMFVVEHAGGVKGHAELRFVFDSLNPVILIPQKTDSEKEIDSTYSLIYSVEAIMPPGVPYKGDYGFREEFFQRYRICSIEYKSDLVIKKLGRRVWQYAINITDDQKTKMVEAAINFATKADPNERYHTGKRNCALRAFDVVNKESKIAWYRKPLLLITNNTLFLPTRAFKHLKYRGLISGKMEDYFSSNLEVELGWEEYINLSIYEE